MSEHAEPRTEGIHDGDDLISLYIAGLLPKQRAREVERMAEADPELAAEINILRVLVGEVSGPRPSGQIRLAKLRRLVRWPALSRWAGRHKWLAASLLVFLIASTGLSWGAWLILTAPLLEDDFKGGWFNSKIWLPPPDDLQSRKVEGGIIRPGGVRPEKGFLRLVNRGYLRPRQEFPEPIEISLDWKWAQFGLNPLYAEHLTVALRTSGEPSRVYPWELQEGVLIKFNGYTNKIAFCRQPGLEPFASTEESAVPMPAEEWHHIRITDDGETISVYFDEDKIDKKQKNIPALRAAVKREEKGTRLAIYNREAVSVPHESYVRNVIIRRISKP